MANTPADNTGGGRSSRGPATKVSGNQEPGGLVPPYEDRKQGGDVERKEPGAGSVVDGANVGGARGMVETTSGLSFPEPEGTPGGRTASPADEQSAEQSGGDSPSAAATGPAHIPGSPRGEDGGA